MNFRFEEKLKLNKNKLFEFDQWLINNNIFEIYKPREIFSIYYDTKDYKCYHDSNEGLVPRSKLRLRTYNFKNTKFNKFNIEIKKSLNYGRMKSSQKLEDIQKATKYGIYFKKYGICYPKIIVKYKRLYYKFDDIRITLDKNIEFKEYFRSINNKNFNNSCKLVVAEIKYSNRDKLPDLIKKLPFEKIRFSKYCIGLEILNLV
tara:strand:- start:47 stop:655 length:609 start_codon:yes stop_codon:yes gene_type:complete